MARVSEERFRKVSVSRPNFDLFFTERPNLEDTSLSSSSMRLGEDQIVNRESPVLHTGRPNKSNRSCNRGFFTSESTSQSLLKAGLKFTCNLCKFITTFIVQSNYFILFFRMHTLFTSKSHGFKFSSISTSKPKNSKQFEDLGMPAA